jgi:phage gp36-like protein
MIAAEDYKTYIRAQKLSMIIDDDETILEEAELTAASVIKDYLYPYYDWTAIYDAINDHRTVKRWLMVLVIYYIMERIPDKITPERVINNYDDVVKLLEKISDGKASVDLPKLILEDTDRPKTKFRWGSEAKRTHS